MNTDILVRRVKIDDILGTLGRTPDGTSEFVVLNRSALHPRTMERVTGVRSRVPRMTQLVDPTNFGRRSRTLRQRAGLVP